MKHEYHAILGDKLKRRSFIKSELQRRIGSYSRKNNYVDSFSKNLINLKLSKVASYSKSTVQRNRCVISGRGHGVLSKYQLSRFFFRDNSLKLKLPGFRRKSW